MVELALGPDIYDPYKDHSSAVGAEMRALTDEYTTEIPERRLREAFSQFDDLSQKVNAICHAWAAMDSERRDKAVRLRSLYIVRRLERFIHSDIRYRVADYHSSGIMEGDDFWPRTESTTETVLEQLLQNKYGVDVKLQPIASLEDGITKHRMATVRDYEIGKCVIVGGSRLVHFSYAAQPVELDNEKKEI